MTIQNWPDPNRPGVPMYPGREGWHVMEGRVSGQTALTHWNGREWGGGEQVRALNTSPEWYRYVGPVLAPAQISEMLAAERERCAKTAQEISDEYYAKREASENDDESTYADERMCAASECSQAIRNLGAAP